MLHISQFLHELKVCFVCSAKSLNVAPCPGPICIRRTENMWNVHVLYFGIFCESEVALCVSNTSALLVVSAKTQHFNNMFIFSRKSRTAHRATTYSVTDCIFELCIYYNLCFDLCVLYSYLHTSDCIIRNHVEL